MPSRYFSLMVMGSGWLGIAVAVILIIAIAFVGFKEYKIQAESVRQAEEKNNEVDERAKLVWASPDQAVQVGHLKIQIEKISIGNVPVITADRQSAFSSGKLLMIRLNLLNTNQTNKVEYQTWGGKNDLTYHRQYATLYDNLGNRYMCISFGPVNRPEGAIDQSESIYPNKIVTDLLVFELPNEGATEMDLELPAGNYGSEGMVRFRIPMKSVTRVSE
jgi:hypothetical protein